MSEQDRTHDRTTMGKVAEQLDEEMAEKGPLEAVRDDMSDVADRVKDAVSGDDEGDDEGGADRQPPIDGEPRVDEVDRPRGLPGDQPSPK